MPINLSFQGLFIICHIASVTPIQSYNFELLVFLECFLLVVVRNLTNLTLVLANELLELHSFTMSDIVDQSENLGKKYIIGHQSEKGLYAALRDILAQNVRSVWHKTKDLVQGKPIILGDTMEDVWTLRYVSFEIRRGEALGIISGAMVQVRAPYSKFSAGFPPNAVQGA